MTIDSPVSKQQENEIKEFYGLDTLMQEKDWEMLLELAGFEEIVIKQGEKSLANEKQMPEFNFSSNFEPELFDVLNKHAEIIIKYQDFLSYRIITCTKK